MNSNEFVYQPTYAHSRESRFLEIKGFYLSHGLELPVRIKEEYSDIIEEIDSWSHIRGCKKPSFILNLTMKIQEMKLLELDL